MDVLSHPQAASPNSHNPPPAAAKPSDRPTTPELNLPTDVKSTPIRCKTSQVDPRRVDAEVIRKRYAEDMSGRLAPSLYTEFMARFLPKLPDPTPAQSAGFSKFLKLDIKKTEPASYVPLVRDFHPQLHPD